MDHFNDFQEKDGYESTKPLDVLPNKLRCNDFGDNHDQDENFVSSIFEVFCKVFSELYPVETNGINDLLRKLGVGNFGETML